MAPNCMYIVRVINLNSVEVSNFQFCNTNIKQIFVLVAKKSYSTVLDLQTNFPITLSFARYLNMLSVLADTQVEKS